jgi:uncharacterized protein (DUF362 family)
MKNIVNITKTNGYENISPKIRSSINEAAELNICKGDSVLIKINLCNLRAPSSGAITHPLFLDALLRYLREKYQNLDIVVVESDATVGRPDIIIKWFGFDKILKKWATKYYNLSKHPKIVKTIDGYYFKEIEISEIFDRCDYFITMPKLKTHPFTKITASLKNQLGCLPYWRKVIYHNKIDDVIADANLAMKPDFCLVDGVLSMGGGGETYGIPLKSNIIICGTDPISVDTACAKVMGFNPKRIGHIKKSEKLGVGTSKYILNGDLFNPKELNLDFKLPIWKGYGMDFGRYLKNRISLAKYLVRLQSHKGAEK